VLTQLIIPEDFIPFSYSKMFKSYMYLLTSTLLNGFLGPILSLFLRHVPQYGGRRFSQNCSNFGRGNLPAVGYDSTMLFATLLEIS
jgi:hypothetical protein